MEARGVLVELLNVPDELKSEPWQRWYDEAVLARRAALPGVHAARRGAGVVGSVEHIAVYDLDNFLLPFSSQWVEASDAARAANPPTREVQEILAHVESTLFRQILSTVDAYTAPPTPVLHAAFFNVDPHNHSEFNDWYNTEHVRFVDVIAGYLNCRRFQAFDDPRRFLALYDVESMDVAQSEEVARANESPWTDRVRSKLATYRERRVFQIERAERALT